MRCWWVRENRKRWSLSQPATTGPMGALVGRASAGQAATEHSADPPLPADWSNPGHRRAGPRRGLGGDSCCRRSIGDPRARLSSARKRSVARTSGCRSSTPSSYTKSSQNELPCCALAIPPCRHHPQPNDAEGGRGAGDGAAGDWVEDWSFACDPAVCG